MEARGVRMEGEVSVDVPPGQLFRLWRPEGELRSIGVWRADSEEELLEKVLGTLPLRPWMSLTVTALVSHPNDPGASAGAS